MHVSDPRLVKDIGVIVLLKLVALALLWYCCFGPGHEMRPDASAVSYHLAGKP